MSSHVSRTAQPLFEKFGFAVVEQRAPVLQGVAIPNVLMQKSWRNAISEIAPMNPSISVITLGVHNLERAVAFYRDGLGFTTKGIVGVEYEHGAVAFFQLQSGLKLALWPRTSIAHDTGLAPAAPSATGLTLGHNVGSPEEVDTIMALADKAGGIIVKPAQATFYGGYAGYFQDTEGHVWEVVYNPSLATL